MEDKTYVIDSEAEDWVPYTGNWAVVTTPATHTLCGDMTVKPQYENNDLAGGEPISYDLNGKPENTFTI